MRTAAQHRNLLILRDEILPGIEEGELDMEQIFDQCGTPCCLIGHARVSRRFKGLTRKTGFIYDTFGTEIEEWQHIFGPNLPNDPTWLAANITDLLESDDD